MVIVKSPYPQPPPAPETNIHNITFNVSDPSKIQDYVLAIDGVSGKQRMFYDFRDQVYDGAAILGLSAADGGLGLDASRDIVGLYSGNCLVCQPCTSRSYRANIQSRTMERLQTPS